MNRGKFMNPKLKSKKSKAGILLVAGGIAAVAVLVKTKRRNDD